MNVIKRNIPNGITCINVLAGTLAILAATHPQQQWCSLSGLQWAWVLIGIAAVADFLDGFSARLLKAYSDMGKELDSLCDLVSFGVAPAVVLHESVILTGGDSWLAWSTPLIAVCGALRLARFNVSAENNDYFTGLPIPGCAMFWIGYSAWLTDLQVIPQWVTAVAIIALSWLMVSNLQLFTLKFKSWGLKGNLRRWALIVAAILLLLCAGVAGLMWTVILYLLLSLALPKKK